MSVSPDLRNVRADYNDRTLRRLADLQDELALVAWQVDAEAIVAFSLDRAVQADEQDRGVGAGRQSGGPGDGWRRVRGVGLLGLRCRVLRVAALALPDRTAELGRDGGVLGKTGRRRDQVRRRAVVVGLKRQRRVAVRPDRGERADLCLRERQRAVQILHERHPLPVAHNALCC